MQENIQNNFVLLSKIAKEKKYAQEYLGLLARRGDMGSIRIGKRWYTTWQWFEEFLENSQKKSSFAKATADKKEVATEMQISNPVKVSSSEHEAEKVKINIPFVFPEREKVMALQGAVNIQRAENASNDPTKIAVAVKTKREDQIITNTVPVSKIEIKRVNSPAMPAKSAASVRIAIRAEKNNGIGERKIERTQDIRVQTGNRFQGINRNQFSAKESNFRNITAPERKNFAAPYQEVEIRNIAGVFSPDISADESGMVPLFPRFAFAMSFAIILLLAAASGYFVYSGGMPEKGKVAGASDERNAGFSSLQSGSEIVLTSVSDKIVESVSVSRVVMEAARERGNQGN